MPKPPREQGRPEPSGTRADARKAIESIELRLQWLEKEVEILEDKIQFFDDLSFKIKGWAIATWSALVTYALSKHEWRVSAVACLVPVLFLLVDASYKRYQVCFIERTRDIMRLLNNPEILTAPANEGGYSFVVYDLLGIHGRGKQETSFNRQWGPIARLAAKASVGLVYWVLVLIGAVITLHLLTSVAQSSGA